MIVEDLFYYLNINATPFRARIFIPIRQTGRTYISRLLTTSHHPLFVNTYATSTSLKKAYHLARQLRSIKVRAKVLYGSALGRRSPIARCHVGQTRFARQRKRDEREIISHPEMRNSPPCDLTLSISLSLSARSVDTFRIVHTLALIAPRRVRAFRKSIHASATSMKCARRLDGSVTLCGLC